MYAAYLFYQLRGLLINRNVIGNPKTVRQPIKGTFQILVTFLPRGSTRLIYLWTVAHHYILVLAPQREKGLGTPASGWTKNSYYFILDFRKCSF